MSKVFENRIKKIEKEFKKQNAPVEILCVSSLDPDGLEKQKRAAEVYFSKYGCHDGLIFVHNNIPEPRPVPEGFKLKIGKPCSRIGEE